MLGRADVAVVGGGIVGLATAWRLLGARPGLAVRVLEKEDRVAAHQSGRNSGVLHSGVYYRPGSLKAECCRAGKRALEDFCAERGVPFDRRGKVIVAAEERELARIDALLDRGRANGVACERIGPERLRELEPHARGLAALHVPEAGVVDFARVCAELARAVSERGGEVLLGARVLGAEDRAGAAVLATTRGALESRLVVNCAGLHSDRVARLFGERPRARIVPFRGEYWLVRPDRRHLCRALVYPVPDPRLPFLGAHLTRRIDGSVECGPNAVVALAREGDRWGRVVPRDVAEVLCWAGFARLAARHWRAGLGELARSLSKRAFVRSLRRLVPEIDPSDLEPGPAGVRAQAVAPSGELLDDFVLHESARAIHVVNAPSPAATASLEIGRRIADRALARFGD